MKEIEIGEWVKIGDNTYEVIGDDAPTLTKIEIFKVGDYIHNGFRYLQICMVAPNSIALIEPKDGIFYSENIFKTTELVFTYYDLRREFNFLTLRRATVDEVFEDIKKGMR